MKKIIIAVFIIFIYLININQVKAYSGKLDKISIIYNIYNQGLEKSYSRNSSYRLYIDDVLTYCISPGVLFKEGEGYYIDNNYVMDKDIKRQMELTSYYGYGYQNHNDIEYYIATQEMIHNLLSYNATYNYGNYDVNAYKEEISNLILKHNQMPNIPQNISLVEGINSKYIDSLDILKYFEIEHSINLEVNIINNEIDIKLLYGDSGEIRFYKGGDINTTFYVKDTSQTVADFQLKKELIGTININRIPSGKIEVTDQNRATFEGIEGTKYNLLDSSFNVIETKITDKNGYLIFDSNYKYGTYYVEEVEAINYPRNEYLIIANLQNELFTAPFFHGKMGSIKVINKNEEGEKLNGTFSLTSPTNYGFTFEELVVGTYYIKQETIDYGYILDQNTYEVIITKDNLNQSLEVINKKYKGTLEIINKDEEGNILNGTFQIYDEENNIVDKTNLDLGTYYIKQETVDYGYILDQNIYEVIITKDNLNQNLEVINKKLEMLPRTSGETYFIYLLSFYLIFLGYILKRIKK